ncbi:MAG: sodium:solute symporter, partial [Planctomycetes bacterium]|nr:sodium:solute symporter [Planctomycetota bacterium]
SAFAKVPMQAGVLFLGVLLYLFYVLQGPPLLFDPSHVKKAGDAPLSSVIAPIEAEHRGAAEQLRRLAGRIASGDANGAEVDAFRRAVATERRARSAARREVLLHDPEVAALAPAQQKARKTPNDTNYIFPHFVLSHVPMVFVGLIMAAIFAAMMSSADSTLNALTASSIVDIYRRWLRPAATEAQALRASRVTSVLWGLAATGAALLFRGTGSVIEVVNQIGSFFYGSLLGVFVLAMVAPRAGPRAGVIGLCGGMLSVLATYWFLSVEFLWFNVIGCVGVLVFGGVASAFDRRR